MLFFYDAGMMKLVFINQKCTVIRLFKVKTTNDEYILE